MNARRARALCIAGFALLLAACGQRGALYLPDQQSEVVSTPAASTTAGRAPEEDEEAAARRNAPAPAAN